MEGERFTQRNEIKVVLSSCSVHGPYLFSYICKNKEYTETTVQFFMKQLLNAVNWIHGQNLMHLDLKVRGFCDLFDSFINLIHFLCSPRIS